MACRGNDPYCPCQDGDSCHYVDDPATGTKAWPRTWQLDLPYASPPLTLNSRMHHMKAYGLSQQIKTDVGWLARAKKLPRNELCHVRIELHWQPSIRRHRDTDNPSLTLKHCIDALVTYGLVPDDNRDVVTSSTVIHEVVRGRARMWLNIIEVLGSSVD